MALAKQVIPYEILVRLGPAGYQAAHVAHMERITDGEEVIVERVLAAEPISVAGAGEILGAASVQLLEQIDGLTADLAAETQRADQAESARDAAIQRAEAAEAALGKAEAAAVAPPAEKSADEPLPA